MQTSIENYQLQNSNFITYCRKVCEEIDARDRNRVGIIDVRRFLHLLDPQGNQFSFRAFPEHPESTVETIIIFQDTLDNISATLKPLNSQGAGISFTVNETDGTGFEIENIRRVRAVFADFDRTPTNLPLEPSIIIETSPGRFHYYWLCDELSKNDFSGAMRRLAEDHGANRNATDLVQELRLPDFVNQKYTREFMIRIIGGNQQRYTREQILAAFPPLLDLRSVQDALRNITADDYDAFLRVCTAFRNAAIHGKA